ncbi:MAG: hypothetical protein ABH858_06250 [Candidatus Omnitrophota bacterium]
MNKINHQLSDFLLIALLALLIFYSIFLQFFTPTLYGADGYYHIAASRFLKDYGPQNSFRWAQLSTFRDFFSDKDFLFHLLSIPALYLSKNIIIAAKYAVIFYNLIFLLAYMFVLRKYLSSFLAACFMILPFFSSTFTIYFLYLRPATLANILTILGIYFLIQKKWLPLFVISILYPLSHISFFTLIFLALLCETIRYLINKEFFSRNLSVVIIGCILGCLIHPNNPNNWLSLYLNGIVVPFYSIMEKGIQLGAEFTTPNLKNVFLSNIAVFFTLFVTIWITFLTKPNLTLPTFVWWGCSNIYLILACLGNRYWYTANILFFIFFASYLNDYFREKTINHKVRQIRIFLFAYFLISIASLKLFLFQFGIIVTRSGTINAHYEKVAAWMNKNIPAGETIYHAYWSDSPYFICLNPKNNYLVVLDPIYMFYPYPREYVVYRSLNEGKIAKPYYALKKIFQTMYGYTAKTVPLYKQIDKDKEHFDVVYEDTHGVIFHVIK